MIEIGDIVLCVDAKNHNVMDIYPPLKEGQEYLVTGINVCKCGRVGLDVGIDSGNELIWCECGETTNDGIWWCDAKRFVKRRSIFGEVTEPVECEHL